MRSSDRSRAFTVVIADNFHYMDKSEHYEHGSFDTLEAAIEASRAIVDTFLTSSLTPGMSAEQLYEQYVAFGDDPFILGADEPGVPFSAWEYAKGRCAELCSSPPVSEVAGHDV
jgi:hypothetical protein